MEMHLINRDVLILFPKQPLIDWINSVFPEDKVEFPEPMMHDEGTVYLLPEKDAWPQSIEYLKRNYKPVFEDQLWNWCTDLNTRPKKLTWKMFEEWFDYSIQSMVLDTTPDAIIKEEM